jgi:hypothetical protein
MGYVGTAALAAAKLPSFLMMTKTTIALDHKQNYKSFLQISNVGFQSFKIFVHFEVAHNLLVLRFGFAICGQHRQTLPRPVCHHRQTDRHHVCFYI